MFKLYQLSNVIYGGNEDIQRKPLIFLHDKFSRQRKLNTCFVKEELKLMNSSAVIFITLYLDKKLNSNGQRQEQLLG
jgi:hypothetical protein